MIQRIKRYVSLFLFWSMVYGLWSSVSVYALPKDPLYPLSQAILVSKTLYYIDHYYLEPARIDPKALFEAALIEIQKTIPEILVKCEARQFCAITVNQATRRFPYPAGELSTLKNQFRAIFDFMAKHVDPDTEKHDIEYSAIIGMLAELDPHSNFMSPEVYKEFRVGTEGEFGGLGIVISIKEGQLTVTAPLEGTPAWKAGIKSGDHILQIDEESTINMSLTEAVERLRGRPGSKVRLRLERTGLKEPILVTLLRAIINIEAVQSKLVQTPKGRSVGFLRVKSFQSNTEREVLTALAKMSESKQKLSGVILDLRNNPGGLLDQAVYLADAFLPAGVIVSTVGKNARLLDRKQAKMDGIEQDWPLIVLVNEGSASASEIVAGALKNNNRAVVIGNKTFGKGSVQSIYELPKSAALKMTVGEYLTPGDQSIQSIGIVPDIELIPILVSQKNLDTIKNIQTLEKDLEKHLAQKTQTIEHPRYRLNFLAPPPEKEEAQEYSAELNLKDDLAAALALTLMDRFTASSRPQMLGEIQEAITAQAVEEDKKIIAQFQKLGVDWNAAKASLEPQVQLSYHLLKNGKEISKAQAGDEVVLKIQVKNVGEGPFYRLAAQTDSKIYYFRNLEFAFGRLLPGETKEWMTMLKIPKANLSEEDVLELHFSEANQRIPPMVRVILPVAGNPRPHFAHQFGFEAGEFAKLNRGQPAVLTVTISNEGKGKSLTPVVALKNLGGKEVFIEKGREVLKDLLPGAKATVQFRFHLAPNTIKPELRFELSITDADLIVRSEQELVFNLAAAALTPTPKQWYRPPTIRLASQTEKTKASPLLLEGEALDDQTIRDVYIFVGEEKAFYEANVTPAPKFNFKTKVPLQEGNNTILITARDNDNLVSTQMQVIRFEAAPKEEHL